MIDSEVIRKSAQLIKNVRKKNKLNQREFAQILEISQPYLSLVENGKVEVTADVFIFFCLKFKVDTIGMF